MKTSHNLIAISCGLLLAACEADKGTTLQDNLAGNTADGIAVSNLDYGNSVIPFPNDILFLDDQGMPPADGTLNIPLTGSAADGPLIAMNALDGFSTSAPITTGFTGALDETSLPAAVKLYEVTTVGGGVASVDAALTYGVDFVASQSVASDGSATLAIVPLRPLDPKQTYMPVITSALLSDDGQPASRSASYALTQRTTPLIDGMGNSTSLSLSNAQAQSLEALRQATLAAETALNTFDGTASADIILSWVFTTQSVGDVLSVVRSLAGTPASGFSASSVDLDGPGALPAGITPGTAATIYEGTIDVPYYLETGAAALSSHWLAANPAFTGDTELNLTQFNPLPAVVDPGLTIPVLATLPNSGSKPYPVVIFQHGITTNRTVMLGIADALATAGFATVAIDLPMHGVDSSSPFYQSGNERTFDLDLVDNTSGAAGADGSVDASGTHFVNLVDLLNTRDNLRQAAADMAALTAALGSMDIDGAGGADDLDTAEVHLVGHSLGAMVGAVYAAQEPSVISTVLAFGGGSLPKILDGSAAFSPSFTSGLAANGVVKGTAGYESFLVAAQTAVDSGDPINYAAGLPMIKNVLFFEIAGGAGSPSDLVVPNTVPDGNDTTGTVAAPLAGTEPMVGPRVMDLTATDTNGATGDLLVRFNQGHHGSLITPDNNSGNPNVSGSAEVFAEIQSQTANYLGSALGGGTATLVISDPDVVAAP